MDQARLSWTFSVELVDELHFNLCPEAWFVGLEACPRAMQARRLVTGCAGAWMAESRSACFVHVRALAAANRSDHDGRWQSCKMLKGFRSLRFRGYLGLWVVRSTNYKACSMHDNLLCFLLSDSQLSAPLQQRDYLSGSPRSTKLPVLLACIATS